MKIAYVRLEWASGSLPVNGGTPGRELDFRFVERDVRRGGHGGPPLQLWPLIKLH